MLPYIPYMNPMGYIHSNYQKLDFEQHGAGNPGNCPIPPLTAGDIFLPSKTCPQDSQNDVNIWENIWENQVESSQISQKGIERSQFPSFFIQAFEEINAGCRNPPKISLENPSMETANIRSLNHLNPTKVGEASRPFHLEVSSRTSLRRHASLTKQAELLAIFRCSLGCSKFTIQIIQISVFHILSSGTGLQRVSFLDPFHTLSGFLSFMPAHSFIFPKDGRAFALHGKRSVACRSLKRY